MGERVLSDEEVKRLGLDAPKKERVLSDEEVQALGLDAPPKPARVPSPTGWRDVGSGGIGGDVIPGGGKRTFRDDMADLDKQNEAMWGAIASGLHGPALAMEGPVAGAIEQAKHPGASPPELRELYRSGRDEVVNAQKENLRRFPNAPMVGSVLSGAAGAAPSAVERVLMAGGQGAVYGLGSSDADVTKGEIGPALADSGAGFVVGGAGGVLGEGVNRLGQGVANKLGGVLSKNREAAQLAADKAFRSARGAYGAEVSSASRTLELLQAAASGADSVDPDLQAAAKVFLASPEGVALRNQVVRSSLGRMGDQMGRMQGARDAMMDAIEGQQGPAVDAAAQARVDDPSALTRRLRDLLPKLILPSVGAGFGGPAGAGAGALSAAVLGRSGTTVRNMMADPYVASRVLGTGAAALRGAGDAAARAGAPFSERARDSTSESLLQPYLDLLEEERKP